MVTNLCIRVAPSPSGLVAKRPKSYAFGRSTRLSLCEEMFLARARLVRRLRRYKMGWPSWYARREGTERAALKACLQAVGRKKLIRLKTLSLLLALAVSSIGADRASAAAVDLFNPAQPFSTLNISPAQSRQTLFEVVNPVTLTELGAYIDPASSSQAFDWRIYASTAVGAVGAAVFEQLGNSFIDNGFGTYDTAVSVTLDPGYYLLELYIAAGGSVTMRRFDDSQQGGYPLTTTDGNFRVIDGYATLNNPLFVPGVVSANGVLPAFSVTAAAPVPLPAPVILLGAALALMPRCRRRV